MSYRQNWPQLIVDLFFVEHRRLLRGIKFTVKYVQMMDVSIGFGAILVFDDLFPEDEKSPSQCGTVFDV